MMSMEINQPPEYPIVQCGYCGKSGPFRMHSGVYECQSCWDWRKLNGPAARYWTAAIDRLFYDPETGSSGPDLIDVEQWTKWGLLDEMSFALYLLRDVQERYQEMIDARNHPATE